MPGQMSHKYKYTSTNETKIDSIKMELSFYQVKGVWCLHVCLDAMLLLES